MALLSGKAKFARIQDLKDWGFNTPVSYSISSELEFNRYEWVRMFANVHKWKRVSVRFEGLLGADTPVLINIPIDELDKYVDHLESHEFKFYEGVPIATWSGCLMVFRKTNDFIIELGYKVSVRHITWAKIIPDVSLYSCVEYNNWRGIFPDERIENLIDEALTLPLESDYIVEASIFDKPLGCNKSSILFWEYEEIEWTHELLILSSRYPQLSRSFQESLRSRKAL